MGSSRPWLLLRTMPPATVHRPATTSRPGWSRQRPGTSPAPTRKLGTAGRPCFLGTTTRLTTAIHPCRIPFSRPGHPGDEWTGGLLPAATRLFYSSRQRDFGLTRELEGCMRRVRPVPSKSCVTAFTSLVEAIKQRLPSLQVVCKYHVESMPKVWLRGDVSNPCVASRLPAAHPFGRTGPGAGTIFQEWTTNCDEFMRRQDMID